MHVSIGVTAGVKAYEYQQAVVELNDLANQLTAATNTPPDLKGMANDTTGLGLFKIANSVMPATLKANAAGTLIDVPSTAPLPAYQLGTDLEFERASDSTTFSTLSYKGWNGETWSAQSWGGWFVQTCANGTKINDQTDGTCNQADSLSGDLHYIDSRFKQYLNGLSGSAGFPQLEMSRYTAARFGDKFLATRGGGKLVTPSFGLNACPALPAWGGLSPGIDEFLKSCWTYIDRRLPVVAADGTNTVAELTNYLSPTLPALKSWRLVRVFRRCRRSR
jgi:hypothetical protein